MKDRLVILLGVAAWLLFLVLIFVVMTEPAHAEEPVHGPASHYGPGTGVATQWCTWTLRHSTGCGTLTIQSDQTGLTVIAPVIDWCQCYRGTAMERIVDLQWSVVAALGLDLADGLYPVTVWRGGGSPPDLPDTAMEEPHARQ